MKNWKNNLKLTKFFMETINLIKIIEILVIRLKRTFIAIGKKK